MREMIMTYEEKIAMYEEKLKYEVCPMRIRQLEGRKYALMFEEVQRRLNEFVGPKMEIPLQ
jgi:hypothetical protein